MYVLFMLGIGFLTMVVGTILNACGTIAGMDMAWMGLLLFAVGVYLFWRKGLPKKREVICSSGATYMVAGLVGMLLHVDIMFYLIPLGAVMTFLEWATRPFKATFFIDE